MSGILNIMYEYLCENRLFGISEYDVQKINYIKQMVLFFKIYLFIYLLLKIPKSCKLWNLDKFVKLSYSMLYVDKWLETIYCILKLTCRRGCDMVTSKK